MRAQLAIALLALTFATISIANETLRAELEVLLEKDQRHRGKGYFSGGSKLQTPLDQENISVLRELVAIHGWPRMSAVGEDAALGAFLVVQHASLEDQERYLPMLRDRYAEGEAKGAWLGLLIDRIRIRSGEPQLYGTQYRPNPETGETEPHPIESPELVNERRESLGMRPLSDAVLSKVDGR